MNYLRVSGRGIVPFPKKRTIKSIFCKHKQVIEGEACSQNGLVRISGDDLYAICEDCGKILAERHTRY